MGLGRRLGKGSAHTGVVDRDSHEKQRLSNPNFDRKRSDAYSTASRKAQSCETPRGKTCALLGKTCTFRAELLFCVFRSDGSEFREIMQCRSGAGE